MKKLALLFIGLIGCAPQLSAPAKDVVEITMRRGVRGMQTIVDYKVSSLSNHNLTSGSGTTLALELQTKAFNKANEICKQSQLDGVLVSGSFKQENGEISGRAIVLCVAKEQENAN